MKTLWARVRASVCEAKLRAQAERHRAMLGGRTGVFQGIRGIDFGLTVPAYPSVTAPSEAEDTVAAYFASTPRV